MVFYYFLFPCTTNCFLVLLRFLWKKKCKTRLGCGVWLVARDKDGWACTKPPCRMNAPPCFLIRISRDKWLPAWQGEAAGAALVYISRPSHCFSSCQPASAGLISSSRSVIFVATVGREQRSCVGRRLRARPDRLLSPNLASVLLFLVPSRTRPRTHTRLVNR